MAAVTLKPKGIDELPFAGEKEIKRGVSLLKVSHSKLVLKGRRRGDI